jgi:signal transduction histidine kinase
VFAVDLHIDELLFRDFAEVPGTAPGRMSPYSAVALVGIGIALLAFHVPSLRPLAWAAAALTAVVGAVPIAGYVSGASIIVGNRWISPAATSIAFVLLGAGTLAASAGADATHGAVPRSAIERKVLAAFVGALILLFAGAAFTYRASIDLTDSLEGIARMEQLRDALSNLTLALAGAEAAQSAYLLTHRQQQRDEYERLAASARAHQHAIAAGVAREPSQASDLSELNGFIDLRLALLATVISLFDQNGLSSAREAIATDEGMRSMGAIREIAARMDDRGANLLVQREATLSRSRELTLGSLLLTLAVAVGMFLTLFRGISREMQARIAAAQALRERSAQVEAANQELEAFAYSVSHDLRTPLRHIDGYLEMLLDQNGGELSENARQKLEVIGDSSRRMSALIEDLLAFSRVSRAELRLDRVDLNTLVRDVIAGLEMETRGRSIEWRVGPLPAVLADEAMLRQVFSNLISNAIKYTSPRDAALIEVGSAGEEDGKPVLFVRDNGVGFDMKYAGRLFGIFQRLHRAEEFEGTGIGLANVHRIVTRHGGRVWAEAQPGHGAVFYLTLQPAAAHGR